MPPPLFKQGCEEARRATASASRSPSGCGGASRWPWPQPPSVLPVVVLATLLLLSWLLYMWVIWASYRDADFDIDGVGQAFMILLISAFGVGLQIAGWEHAARVADRVHRRRLQLALAVVLVLQLALVVASRVFF